MKLFIPEHIQLTQVESQTILLDCRENRYYAVSKTGAEFLKRLQINEDMKAAIEYVSHTYQISYERVEQDMNYFVQHLQEKRLLVEL